MRCGSALWAQAIVCLTGLALGACRRHPVLIDMLGVVPVSQQLNISDHDVRELAPIIVVASVEENKIVSKHVEASRYPGVYLDLHAVRCQRENSLRGGLAGAELQFFYFADGRYRDSRPEPLFKRLFQADPGSRYLFFLTRDRGVLRSVGDVGDYSILISTGTHPESSPNDADTGTLVSEVLLAPGNGANLNLMAKKLSEYRETADNWGSRPLTVQLLRHLTSLPQPVRFQACGVLVAFYHGQDDCLRAMAEDANESPENRQEASRELKEQGPFRQRLLESLRDPAQLAYLDWAGDSRHRLREEFQTMLLGTDAILRERACTALKRYFPWDPEPKCAEAKERHARQ
jgi:hypothetical protein